MIQYSIVGKNLSKTEENKLVKCFFITLKKIYFSNSNSQTSVEYLLLIQQSKNSPHDEIGVDILMSFDTDVDDILVLEVFSIIN